MKLRLHSGFSIVELMVVMVVLGIIAAIAAPSLSSYIDHRRVINTAEAVYGQLQLARSEAIARSETVYANFSSNDSTTWAMGISTRQNCDVTQTVGNRSDDCVLITSDGDATLDTGDGTTDLGDLLYYGVSSVDHPRVTLGDGDSGTATDSIQITFDSVRGTVTSDTIVIKYGNEYEARVVLFETGRIRICSPNGDTKIPGYSSC